MKPVIIASMGRAGSTLMFEVVCQKYRNGNFVIFDRKRSLLDDWAYKTHSLPDFIPDNAKVIYLFTNPMDCIVSAHKYTNMQQHYIHLGGDWDNHEKWLEQDTLRLEKNFDAWYRPQRFELMTLRYETMFDYIDEIKGFCQAQLNFPPRRERRVDWSQHESAAKLLDTYRGLDEKVANAKDMMLWMPKS